MKSKKKQLTFNTTFPRQILTGVRIISLNAYLNAHIFVQIRYKKIAFYIEYSGKIFFAYIVLIIVLQCYIETPYKYLKMKFIEKEFKEVFKRI